MKVVSLKFGDAFFKNDFGNPLTGRLDGGIFHVARQQSGFISDKHYDYRLSLAGGSFTQLDEGRSVGKAAAGAVIGGVLTGGLGLLIGGAIGARKKHTLVLKHPSAILVVELSSAEVEDLIGQGYELGANPGTPIVQGGERKRGSGCAVALLVLSALVIAFVVWAATASH